MWEHRQPGDARSQQELARHDEARQEGPETLPHAARHRNPLLVGLSGRPGIFCSLLVGPFATRPSRKSNEQKSHIHIHQHITSYIHVYSCIRTLGIGTHMQSYTIIYTKYTLYICVYIHKFIYVCIHMYVYVYAHTYLHLCVDEDMSCTVVTYTLSRGERRACLF